VRTDHADPSIYTVLSVPLDETGQNLLDLVVFPPRWDATEHTFRPPYFHRNATTEFNGLITSPRLDGNALRPGACFLTPPMTPHGVRARDVESSLQEEDAIADMPRRIADDSLWFQFESSLPMRLSAVAKKCSWRVNDWRAHWGAYRSHFRPNG
jgi:homogentisate 1,2-dioxygenase